MGGIMMNQVYQERLASSLSSTTWVSRVALLLMAGLLFGCGHSPTAQKTSSAAGESTASIDLAEADANPNIEAPDDNITDAPANEPSLVALREAVRKNDLREIRRAAIVELARNPKSIPALNALGLWHYRANQPLAAQYFFQQAIRQQESADLHNNQGLVHLALKESAQALASFRRAIRLDPRHPQANANLGSLFAQNRDFARALPPLQIAAERNPKDVRVLTNYGAALANAGKRDQAKTVYEQALAVSGNQPHLLLNFATLWVDRFGQAQPALDLLARLRFAGVPEELRVRVAAVEARARALGVTPTSTLAPQQ